MPSTSARRRIDYAILSLCSVPRFSDHRLSGPSLQKGAELLTFCVVFTIPHLLDYLGRAGMGMHLILQVQTMSSVKTRKETGNRCDLRLLLIKYKSKGQRLMHATVFCSINSQLCHARNESLPFLEHIFLTNNAVQYVEMPQSLQRDYISLCCTAVLAACHLDAYVQCRDVPLGSRSKRICRNTWLTLPPE
jgi:hypothetical protein